jgi:hypothetical protein
VSRQPDFSSAPPRAPWWSRGASALVVLALAAAVTSGVAAYRARGEAAEAKARAAEARRQLETQQARLRAVTPAPGDQVGGAADAPPRKIVGAIAGVLPGDARLARLAIDYEGPVSVEMMVDARRAAAWDHFLERLERSPDFAEVEPGPEQRDAEVRTTVRGRWSGGAR